MKQLFTLFALIMIIPSSIAQEVSISGRVNAQGLFADEVAPFWLRSNNAGLRSALTNGVGYAFAKANYDLSTSFQLEAGAGFMYRDGFEDRLQRDQLYLQLIHKWFKATLGSQRAEILVDGLSSTNQNILWSGNARAIPGLIIEAPQKLSVLSKFSIDYGLGHYLLNDDRYVDNTFVHYKRLGLFYNTTSKSTFGFTLQHFAQWGGTSPELGKLPSGFSDFVNVFLAQKAGDDAPDGEAVNALGNHLGSYNFSYIFDSDKYTLEVYHEHLFEDGSGSSFKNFPDGVWGVAIYRKQGFFKRFLYEYIDTSNQSGSTGRSGRDNYFSNKIYFSGWTYEGATIGLPFIFRNEPVGRFTSNRSRIHHLGVFAQKNAFDFYAKMSIVKNLGTYARPFDPIENAVYTFAQVDYNASWGTLTLLAGIDSSTVQDINYGVGAGYTYSF